VTAPDCLPSLRRAAAVLALSAVGALAGCAGRPDADPAREAGGAVPEGAQPAQPARPLAIVAGQRVVLVPVQRVAGGLLGVSAPALDAELAFALEERGLAARWTAAEAARRMASRNPTFTGDPGAIDLGVAEPRPGTELEEPAASQLRALAALADARYVVVPRELRADSTGGAARAVLGLVLVDTRRQQVLWAGETAGVPLADAAPAARAARAARIAAQFVDLVAAPPPP
jgi:hypothetical protein